LVAKESEKDEERGIFRVFAFPLSLRSLFLSLSLVSTMPAPFNPSSFPSVANRKKKKKKGN
jgi:hypothetical protein